MVGIVGADGGGYWWSMVGIVGANGGNCGG